MDGKRANKIINRMYKFRKLNTARNFANHCNGTMLIVLGDDDRFWVGVPPDTEKLIEAGYEYAE